MLSATCATISVISPSVKPAARMALSCGVGHVAAVDHDGLGELQAGVSLGVDRARAPAGENLLGLKSGKATEGGVRRQAVLAGVGLGDGERNLLAKRGVECAPREGAVEPEVALERGG
jgi:hypothetical protein